MLYNWTAAKNACPKGWHLPSDAEWKQLEIFLGMSKSEANDTRLRGTNEGSKLKSRSRWNNCDGNGTNASGFSALPGGDRGDVGYFGRIGYNGYFWSSTEYSSSNALYRYLYQFDAVYRHNISKEDGFSVRCLRD